MKEIFPGRYRFSLRCRHVRSFTDSILGREIEPIVQRFIRSMPVSFPVARGPVMLCGALIEIDEQTGRALSIQRVAELYQPIEKPQEKPRQPAADREPASAPNPPLHPAETHGE